MSDEIRRGIQSISAREESISYKNRGDEQVKLGKYEKAIDYYEQSISVDSNEYSISNKALCLNKISSYSQSIETANEGIERINQFNLVFTSLAGKDETTGENKRPQIILLKLYYRKAKALEELGRIK